MAWFEIGSGGGKTLEETVLWNNSAPTASTFASQYVTLSDDITNYDFIEITFKGYYNSATILKFRLPVTEWVHCNSSTAQSTGLYLGSSSSANGMCRSVAYSSNTVVAFGTTQYRGASGSNNSYCIPLQISGLKYSEYVSEYKVARGIISVSASATTKVVTGFRPKSIMIMASISSSNMFMIAYDERISTAYTGVGTLRSSNACIIQALPSTASNRIQSIDDDGFTFGKDNNLSSNFGTVYYVAIG